MPIILPNLLNQKPIECINTSVGTLCIFKINTVKDESLLEKIVVISNNNKDDSINFVKNLSVIICFPSNKLKDGKFKPKHPYYKLEEIQELTDSDLEKIAETYIKGHKNQNKIKKSHQQNDENNCQYLQRLLIIKVENIQRRLKEFKDQLQKNQVFPKQISDQINKSFNMGESLNNEINQFDFAEHHRHIREEAQQPFNELSKRLDTIIDRSTNTIKLMVEDNKTQTAIATDIKESGIETDKHSRKNINLTYLVVVLTIIGLATPIYINYFNNLTLLKQQSIFQDNSQSIIQELSAINTNIIKERATGQDASNLLSKQIQNEATIKELGSINQQQNSDIKKLIAKISKLEQNLTEVKKQYNVETCRNACHRRAR